MADAVGAILLAAVTLYAVLGGADFGGGLWDLLAGGDTRGRAPRQLIDESITPVWESNHVWLVFCLVIFWTAFPHAFTAVMNTLALPIWLAVFGVVLRGAGFAFRKELSQLALMRAAGATFALSSLLTPFFMGTVIGAIATGAVPAGATRASLTAWTSVTALLAGFLFVAACGYLAAVYLVSEAAGRGERELETYFALRARVSAIVAGAISLAVLVELHGSDHALFARLSGGRALPLVIVSGLCGLAVLAGVGSERHRWAVRAIAALGVAAIIWGWGIAQYPTLLPRTDLTLTNAGAPHAMFVALVILFVIALVLLVPSFVLLYTLQSRRTLYAGTDHGLAATTLVDKGPRGHNAAAGSTTSPRRESPSNDIEDG